MDRKTTKTRTYSELVKIESFEDRFNYLKLDGSVGVDTFGFDRYLNQRLYKSKQWRSVRNQVILRDNGCDLGVAGRDIGKNIVIHHMNPISVNDILDEDDSVFNLEYLICVSRTTHNAIHYGDENQLTKDPIERKPNDTSPWRAKEETQHV